MMGEALGVNVAADDGSVPVDTVIIASRSPDNALRMSGVSSVRGNIMVSSGGSLTSLPVQRMSLYYIFILA